MAIAYKSQGAGVSTETSGAALSPACPATVDSGDILIGHVFWEGTSDTPSTPANWTLLSGPHVIESTIARHWVFGKIADGTEDAGAVAFGSPAVTTQRGARIYSFSGRVSGGIVQLVNGFSHQSHATDPQGPSVTTSRAGDLAVALVGQNDNNAQGSFTGESGGDWTESVAEYTANLTPGLALQIQTCTPTSDPGTVSGGTFNTSNDPVGVIGFQIQQQDPQTATVTCTTTTTVSMGVRRGCAASVAVTSTATATIVKVQGGTAYQLTAAVAATSTAAPQDYLYLLKYFTVYKANCTSTATASMRTVRALNAAPAGVSAATVSVFRKAQRDVAPAGQSTATATIVAVTGGATGQLTAAPAGLSAATATLYGVLSLHTGGAATGVSTATVAMLVKHPVAATATGSAAASTNIARRRDIKANTATLTPEGDFSFDSANWVLGANWQITGGVASQTSPALSSLRYAITAEVGVTYRVTYTVAGRTAGSIVAAIGSATGASNSANGTYTELLTATTTNQFLLTADGTWDGTVDDVRVEQLKSIPTASMRTVRALSANATGSGSATAALTGSVTHQLHVKPNLVDNGGFNSDSGWTLGAGWVISGGVASNGTQISALQRLDISAEVGARYLITYTIAGRTTGSIDGGFGGISFVVSQTNNGTFAATHTALTTGSLSFTCSATWDGTLDDISVVKLNSQAAASVSVVLSVAPTAAGVATATITGLSVKRAFAASPIGTGSAAVNEATIRALLAAAVGAAIATVSERSVYALLASAAGTTTVNVTVDVSLGTAPVVGKYAAEHAAAYRIVKAAEEGDFAGVHAQAFADVFKAGV